MAGGKWLMTAGLLLAAARPASAQERSVTLEEAITRSWAVQPRVVQAMGATRTAGAQVLQAKGAFLPNLNLNAGGSRFYSEQNRIDNTTGLPVSSGVTTRNLNTSVTSSVEIFDGFRRSATLGAANADERAAEAGLRDARFQQALQTTNTFFDALAASRLVAVREASLRRAEEQLKVSVARYQAGAATRSDSLRSLVGVGNAQLQLVTAQAQLATAEAALGRLIGEGARVQATDDSAFYRIITGLDEASLRAEVVSQSPVVISAQEDYRAAQANLKVARAQYWPSLSLSGSYNLDGSSNNNYTMAASNRLNLSFSWPLFNRFNRETQMAQAAVARDNARAAEDDARRGVQADLTARLADLAAAELRIQITERSVQAAAEDLRVQQERYRLGASTILDVATTQEALTQAEVDAVTARFDYLRAKASIEALIGRTL